MKRKTMSVLYLLCLGLLSSLAAAQTPKADELVKRMEQLTPMEFRVLNIMASNEGFGEDLLRVFKAASPAALEAYLKTLNPALMPRVKVQLDRFPAPDADAAAVAVKNIGSMLAKMGTPAVKARVLVMSGKYAEALPLYEEAFKNGAGKPEEYYDAACAAALAGQADPAFAYLEKASSSDDITQDTLKEDSDLKSLSTDARWTALLAKLQAREDALLAKLPAKHEGTPIALPEPKRDGAFSVEKALQERRSVRDYAKAPLTLADVSQLLWSAYGVSQKIDNAPPFLRGGLKTAPSAGALYPLEVYLVAGEVTGLPAGVYLYTPENHSLVKVLDGDVRAALCKACLGQGMVKQAPVSLVYSAVYERTTKKYGQRGKERYVCMDLGHSGENVYLQATAMGMGTCAIGAFSDLKLRLVVNMTKEEAPLYVMPVGKLARK